MAQNSGEKPRPLDRTGSFFKLVDTFALEIGELKKEMVRTEVSLEGDSDPEVAVRGAEEVVSGVFLQPPSTGGSAGTRDSGYSSLRRRMSVLDRLVQTHPVWLQLSLGEEEAARILKLQPPGTFLVRRSCKLQKKVISLRVDEHGAPVRDFPVEESQYTFSLEGSGISFADLFRLVAFYCISRDVLPFPLRLPEAVAAARTHAELEEVAQQGAAFWDSAVWRRSSERAPALRRDRGRRGASLPALRTRSPAQLECGQSNGALCFVNPLFLRAHRLPEERPTPEPAPSSASRGRVAWENSPPRSDTARDGSAMPETSHWVGSTDEDDAPASPLATPSSAPQVALRRSPEDLLSRLRRASSSDVLEDDNSGGQRLSGASVSTTSSEDPDFSPEIFLQGPPGALVVGDSSLEEEDEEEARAGSDPETSSPPKPRSVTRRGSLAFPSVVKGKIRNALSSLRKPGYRLEQRILELSRDRSSDFGDLVQAHIGFLQENRGMNASAEDLLQTLRQFMTNMKAYLAQCADLDPSLWLLVREDKIDHVLEKAMHKCLLKPLKGVVDAALRESQVRSGAWQQLLENLPAAKAKQPQELGVEGAVPPDPDAIDKIRQKLQTMCMKYSPEKKVATLLWVCKRIYTIMQDNSGRLYGADDFLPMLTYVLAQCDMPQLDAEIQYMMELLDPSLLQGEGGYYLTSAYGAMALIKNFREEQAARMLSLETRNTLHQWHRRRTSERVNPCIEDFQSYLRVALLEAGGGCTAKTFRVPPSYTAADVCWLCAGKFRVADPENHALFLLAGDGVQQQLAPDTHPQRIKAELHSRPRPGRFHFLYRRTSRPPGPTGGAVGRVRPASAREPLAPASTREPRASPRPASQHRC